MSMLQGVHHIAIQTTAENYKKTAEFYTQILEMEVKMSWGPEETPFLMVSCGDNTCMEILPPRAENPTLGGPIPHVCFATDKVDEIVEKVRAAGYKITSEPRDLELAGQPVRNAFFIGAADEVIELFWVK